MQRGLMPGSIPERIVYLLINSDMKASIFLALFTLCCFQATAQSDNPKYDRALAEFLGGDDYGMKPYVLVILKTGPNATTISKSETDSLFRGHMESIQNLVSAGHLIVSGPLKKNENTYRGIFVLNVATIEEANKLLILDPAIKEKLFETELFVWYGSAALPLYLKSHELIEKKKM